MNDKDIASVVADLIEIDGNERVILEALIRQYGISGLLQQLNEGISLSAESVEKLLAVKVIVDRLSEDNGTWEER